MKRVLVTGAGGFVGSRCLPLLEARGFEVHAVSTQSTRGPAWHRCNLLDASECEALLERVRPSHLLHLAWVSQPGLFWTSRANVDWLAAGTRLIEHFYALGGARAVGVGSCAEYGDSDRPCLEDVTAIAPRTEYGEAKAAMSEALRRAARGRGDWAWARIFHPYGPDEPPGRFIPALIDGLMRRERVACTEGWQVRDFVYVEDTAAACVALVDSGVSGAYNVGSGEGCSLREMAQIIVAELGHGELLRFGERPSPAHDPPYVVADIKKLRDAVGWSPRITLREGICRSIAVRSTVPY